MDRPVRVLLDVNIYVGNIMAHDRGHKGTATQALVSMVGGQQWGIANRAQLIISFEMIDTLETVLRRLGYSEDRIKAYSGSIVDIARYGPDALDPYLILGGEERFAMSDVEDAGVLATAVGAKADILVTDNLKDFTTKDASTVETQVVDTTSSGQRPLQALRYETGSANLIVAHPFDVMQWIRLGYDFTPGTLWDAIQRPGKDLGL
ncbi:PIN domain-containing protein [Rhizobium sp. TRM95111]|uniref:PIN domain-containing protein n=1 Tax=Rhizobium alarense TaxID=2846851 RepID=UPI001F35BFB0|nr:PIN domain-containing protein [Rhizobium alarense]MCF3641201.1 PIN domain-containing protein [Rhizobium alarense]